MIISCSRLIMIRRQKKQNKEESKDIIGKRTWTRNEGQTDNRRWKRNKWDGCSYGVLRWLLEIIIKIRNGNRKHLRLEKISISETRWSAFFCFALSPYRTWPLGFRSSLNDKWGRIWDREQTETEKDPDKKAKPQLTFHSAYCKASISSKCREPGLKKK